ncbi:MAG: hypothetical protein RPU52_02550 [Candidatus Sedimenticola sp. (ex Thyasira tokunagai)]
MDIDLGTILAVLALLFTGPLGFIVKQMASKVDFLQQQVAEHKTHVAESYVEKDDLHRELSEIKDLIKRLFYKLENPKS